MKLRAEVRKVLGTTKHYRGPVIGGEPAIIGGVPVVVDGEILGMERMPDARWVEIEEEESGVVLYRFSASGEFAGDSWFFTIEEAMRQAEREYDIRKTDWFEIE
jgi:hypothetical protein